jgi:hypothetical protein
MLTLNEDCNIISIYFDGEQGNLIESAGRFRISFCLSADPKQLDPKQYSNKEVALNDRNLFRSQEDQAFCFRGILTDLEKNVTGQPVLLVQEIGQPETSASAKTCKISSLPLDPKKYKSDEEAMNDRNLFSSKVDHRVCEHGAAACLIEQEESVSGYRLHPSLEPGKPDTSTSSKPIEISSEDNILEVQENPIGKIAVARRHNLRSSALHEEEDARQTYENKWKDMASCVFLAFSALILMVNVTYGCLYASLSL